MKKLSKWFACAISLITLSLTACSNLVDDATIEGATIQGKKTVTLTATSDGNIVQFENSSSRTIMPGIIKANNTDHKFFLWTKNITNGGTEEFLGKDTAIEFTADSGNIAKGTVSMTLDVAQYELELYCVPAASATGVDTKPKAEEASVLKAKAKADFTNGDTVNFYLSPYNLTGKGGVSLKIYSDGWTLDTTTYDVKIGMYELEKGTDTSTIVSGSPAALTTLPATAPAEANFKTSGSTINPGTYNLIVEFTGKSGTSGKKYYYNDQIVILSNQITEGEVKVPEVIGIKPAAPEKLGVYYRDPLTADSDTYDVQFTWADKSYNESNFQLELIDFTNPTGVDDDAVAALAAADGTATDLSGKWGSATATDSTVWNTASAATIIRYTYNKDAVSETGATPTKTDYGKFYDNTAANWVDGSFDINSNYAVLSLKLGHRYVARLCAVNDAGKSDYLYADVTGTHSATPKKAYKRLGITNAADTTLNAFGADTMAINRFRIIYDLGGGIFYKSSTTSGAIPSFTGTTPEEATLAESVGLTKDKTTIIKYGTQNSAVATQTKIVNPLFVETTTPSAYATLYDATENRWTDWLVDGGATAYDTQYFKKQTTTYDNTTPAPVSYMQWDYATPGKTAVPGYDNITLVATYKISQGSWELERSALYNITKDMVILKSGTSSAFSGSDIPAASLVNGRYVFVKGTTADLNAGAEATPALYLYAILVNDAAKVTHTNIDGGVSYYKVVMEVLKNGVTVKTRKLATAGSLSLKPIVDGATDDSENEADTGVSYVEIPLQGLANGSYTIKIKAYADTYQNLYTYNINFELRNASAAGGSSGTTFTEQSKTVAVSSAGIVGAITLTSATPTVVEIDSANATKIISKSAGTSEITVNCATSGSGTFTVTVDADGSMTVTAVDGTTITDTSEVTLN